MFEERGSGPTRRDWLRLAIAAALGIVLAWTRWPRRRWLRVAERLPAVAEGELYPVHPWVWLVREGGVWSALERTCPHQGCGLVARDEELVCPCHGSWFTRTGERLGGPAPRGLRRFPVRVAADGVWVGFGPLPGRRG